MVTTETLAISAIFITGFYFGYKIKEGIYKLKKYLANRRSNF